MKRILPILMVGMMGAGMAAAQTSTSAQAGASTQSQTSVQTNKSGAQASSNGSASTSSSASANAGKNSADISKSTSSSASANAGKSSTDVSKSTTSSASSATANAAKGSSDISEGTKIDATLKNSLDAKKNKPGDRVEAVATHDVKQDGHVVVKKGTRLVGHVTESQARTKENAQSQMGIVFDHAVMSNGQEVPFNASIQALAAAQSSANAAADDGIATGSGMGAMSSGAARSGGGLVGGVTSTAGAGAGTLVNTAGSASGNAGGTLGAASRSTGAVGGLTSTGRLASNSNGVFGMDGLSLNSATSSATQGSMIVSPTRNVHLDSGTQMLLSASGRAQAK